MSTSPTRRAVMAGAAMLPTLALPAASSENHQMIDLGKALRDLIETSHRLEADYRRTCIPCERIERRLVPMLGVEGAHNRVALTPVGIVRSEAWDTWNQASDAAYDLAYKIVAMTPAHSAAGVGVIAMAAFFLDWMPGHPYDGPISRLVIEAARVGGIELPRSMVDGIAGILADYEASFEEPPPQVAEVAMAVQS